MIELPSELIIDIFDLACAEDAHDIEQKLHLAQVCAYWRAVALAYPTFWARIRIRTSRDAVMFRIALGRSCDASLDVELSWHHRVDERILSDLEQRAVIDALIAPAQRLQLRRLHVEHSRAVHESLLPLLSAGLDFPILEDLEFQGLYGGPYLSPRLQAPSLRRLALSTVDLELWVTLITSTAIEYLYLYRTTYVNEEEEAPLLTRILSRCPALRRLEWDYRYDAFASDHAVAETSGSFAPRLHTLHLGGTVDPYEMLRFINQHRTHMDPIHDITASIYYIRVQSLELLPELFQGTGYLVDLRIDETDHKVVIRDNVGRIRRLIFRNEYVDRPIWHNLWIDLATQYAFDKTLESLRMRTLEWNLFARAFSKRLPIALVEVYITVSGDIDYTIRGSVTYSRRPGVLGIPNLHRIVFLHDSKYLEPEFTRIPVAPRVRKILQHIVCDASTRVEVCISEAVRVRMPAPEIVLEGFPDKWVFCTHCAGVCV